ncbi:hypothetical protein E1B28_012391 [Marasmius oreades]|uniref:Uncharacterized protein n=1 Tax=Marasmius oreades TaxID=181124 RepID=A0A9P7RRL7_9AGAR|nr:uncharacterized protein E1B28_012391 [Marasmius oreades]KAG7088392.1 hypothetical protein E1B28_012391 [Marasmius oreades]
MNCIRDIYEEVLVLQQCRALSAKVPLHRIKMFAVDLAMVALSVRTGYLIDAFTLQGDRNPSWTWNQLLQGLCQRNSEFKGVVHIYDPQSEQSFFVNISLFLSRAQRCLLLSSTDNPAPSFLEKGSDIQPISKPTSFVSLLPDGSFHPSFSDIPVELPAVLRELITQTQLISESSVRERSTVTLPPILPYNVTVPLAGFLLEYPVALCPVLIPGTDMSSFLTQVPLRVYRCLLNIEDTTGKSSATSQQNPHLLVQFSIPSVLESSHPETHSSSVISSRLEETFNARLATVFAGRGVPSLTIVHSVRTLDRVAL